MQYELGCKFMRRGPYVGLANDQVSSKDSLDFTANTIPFYIYGFSFPSLVYIVTENM